MRSAIKVIAIIAGILIALGLIVFLIGFAMNGFKFKGIFQSENFEKYEKIIEDDFTSINIKEVNADITIAESLDGTCKVEYCDSEHVKHDIVVENDTLIIEYRDTTKWYERITMWLNFEEEQTLTVYLPTDDFEDVKIENVNGEITITRINSSDEFVLSTVNGDVTVNDCSMNKGEVSTVNGDVKFSGAEAKDLEVSTTNGEVTGSFNGEYKIETDTVNGDIDVPRSDKSADRKLDISTVNGDIDIDFK